MRAGRISVPALLALLATLMCGSATAQEPKVRTSLETSDDVWVGQKIALVVELLAPGYFASAASFDLPDPQGVLLMPPEEHPVVGNETIDGVEYAVQRHELSAYPMRSGQQSIPQLTIRFGFKRAPLDTDETAASLQTTPLPFTVKQPPGTENLGQVISARNLKVAESWQPEPGDAEVQAGAAFTRTITFSAPEVPGMLFPPVDAGSIDGLGIYAKKQLLDQSNRGALQGERRDVITYMCQRPGQFAIPALRFVWFDLESQKVQTVDLPARTLNVVANPALASGAAGDPAAAGPTLMQRLTRDWKPVAVSILALLLVLAALHKPAIRMALVRWSRLFLPRRLLPLNPTTGNGTEGKA